jgi:hypothetical protein
MQFPLRDFFWLTIVIGLTIGIAIERKRAQGLSGYQGQAEWWEKAARELGDHLQEKTGETFDFQALQSIQVNYPATFETRYYDLPNGKRSPYNVTHPARTGMLSVGYARDTRGPRLYLVTGLIDLDILLAMLVLGGPVLAIYRIRRKKPFPPGVWRKPDAPIWQQPSQVQLIISLHTGMSIFAYAALRSPFTGTVFLVGAVIWAYYYCQFVLTKPTPAIAPS